MHNPGPSHHVISSNTTLSTERIEHHVSLCANAKDEYCRLLSVDGVLGILCLWQLDQRGAAFNMVSSVQLQPSQTWHYRYSALYGPGMIERIAATGSLPTNTSVIRSDDKAFIAIFIYNLWSWLIVYDVGRSSWVMAHAIRDSSTQLFQSCE